MLLILIEKQGGKQMNYKGIRDLVEKLGNEHYEDFIKALISYEKGINDMDALDKIYSEFMDSDTVGLLHEDFDYMIDELRERNEISDTDKFEESKYTKEQQKQIDLGKDHNVDTSIYENPLYNHKQMEQLRLGLEYKDMNSRIDVSKYADYRISDEYMKDAREILQKIESLSLDKFFSDSWGQSKEINNEIDKLKNKLKLVIEEAISSHDSLKQDNKDEKDIKEIVGNIAGEIEHLEIRKEGKDPLKITNFTIISNNEEGEKVYTNCSAYGDKTNITKDFNKGDFVKVAGQIRTTKGENGKEYKKLNVISSKLLQAKEQKKESVLGAIKNYQAEYKMNKETKKDNSKDIER